MSNFALYFRYLRLNFLAGLQYRGWPMVFLTVVVSLISDPVAILLLFSRFGAMGDWSVERIMLVYGLALAAFGLAELFSRGYDYFPRQIQSGAFDRILLRPRSTVVQVLGMEFHLHRVSKVVAGLGLVYWSLRRQGIDCLPWQWAQLLFALAAGFLVYTGVFISSSAVAFWTVRAMDWTYIFTNGSYQVAKCPPSLLPRWLRSLFVFLVPMLVFCYYPAAAVCGWGEPIALGWLALPVSALFLMLSLALWRVGVRFYAGTGS